MVRTPGRFRPGIFGSKHNNLVAFGNEIANFERKNLDRVVESADQRRHTIMAMPQSSEWNAGSVA